ncbi:MAG: type IX secretion system protein PorQ [Calditrichia bacterium]
MKKLSRFILIILTVLSGSVFAQSAGTNSFEFLRTQYSPRGAALGGNLIAIKNDPQALLYNPASLAGNTESLWSIAYVDHLLDFQAGHLFFGKPVKGIGNLYAGLIYLNFGSFDETDEFGRATGQTFNAADIAFTAGLSNPLGSGFDYGLSFKLIHSTLENYNASALALDAGIIYTAESLDNLQFGVSLLNLGGTIDNYTDHTENLPRMLQVGFAKRLAHLPLLFTGSLTDLTASEENFADRFKRFSLGGEFDVSEMIKFRLGYQNDVNQSVKPLGRSVISGFSLGLGINWNRLQLAYAYSNFGDLGSQNHIGISGAL